MREERIGSGGGDIEEGRSAGVLRRRNGRRMLAKSCSGTGEVTRWLPLPVDWFAFERRSTTISNPSSKESVAPFAVASGVVAPIPSGPLIATLGIPLVTTTSWLVESTLRPFPRHAMTIRTASGAGFEPSMSELTNVVASKGASRGRVAISLPWRRAKRASWTWPKFQR